MTTKEKDKLVTLVKKILDITDIVHSPMAGILMEELKKATDDQVLDILIVHFDALHLYEIYNRFDREASVRDIQKLSGIISKISEEQD